MSGTLKELRAHLVAAKTALSAGNLAAARESCKSALGVDDESYEAWTFDGKVAFASGDATGALKSYKRAVGIKNDHPAAWQGIAEAAETTGSHAECAAALDALLRMPVDGRSVTGDKKAEWRRRMASALGAAGAWGDASDVWTELAETMGPEGSTGAAEPTATDARRMAAECACSANAAAAEAAAEAAAAEAQRTSVTSRADVASIRSTAMRSHDARCDPRLERTLRTYLERLPRRSNEESDPKLISPYVHSLHGRLLTRALARTAATGTREDALAAMDEAEAIVARHGEDVPEAAAACRAAALESICALNLGLDAEEEGWDSDQGGGRTTAGNDGDGDGDDGDGDARASLERRAARLVSVGSEPSLESVDPCEAVAAAWLALRESGRSGRAAHPPGSAAGAAALPHPGLVALGDALAADESARSAGASDATSTRAITTAASEAAAAVKAAAAPDPLGPGARVVGWSAAAEAAHMAGDAAVALEHARKALKACGALGWTRGGANPGHINPGPPTGCERRVRIVAAEALLSIGRRREASAALGALNDATESPRTLRGLAMCLDGGEGSSHSGGEGCVAALKRAASLAPNAPRPLAELGWAMLRNGGDGVGARATRLLERAATLTAGSVPPDVDARLGVARWTEAIEREAKGDVGEAKACALRRGPNTAHASLLAAAAVDGPFQPLAFAYLARMYDVAGDASRSKKCRARALSLDPADPIAGPDECAARGDDHAYVARTCRDALRAKPRCLWAAVRLAPAASRLGDHEAAVGALQTVLRSVPDSSAAWEALGAAYDALNRHSAALKAYGRAMDIERERSGLGSGLLGSGLTTNSIDDPGGRVFASVRSGRIMHQMGAVRESIAAYESALAVAPGHTAALLGLAEAELGRARMAAGRAPGAAIASAERAAEAATQAIQAVTPGTDAPKRTAVKLIGDAMMVVARCRDPKAIAQGSDDDAIDEREASKPSAATRAAQADAAAEKAARRARRAYARAIHLEPNAACAWRDLAGACVAEGDACASRGVESPGNDESPGRAKCRDVAERCLRGALRVDAADPATWTAIGTLPGAEGADPTRDTARRETALARAVALDPRCAPAWSALGRIYLRCAATEADPGERGVFISRAQRALDNARAADPSDANAWVGTALLHSARGDEGETAGAFRMASDLGAGREADVYRALSGLRAAAEVAAAAASEGAFKPTHDAGTKVTSIGGAYAAARRAVEAAPGDPTARLSLALASEAKGLFVEAAFAYDDVAALLSHHATHSEGDTRGIAIDPDVLAREASAGAERARAGIERGVGAPSALGELSGWESIANVDDVASIAAYVRSARATFRERFESHARVARVEALAGAAAALAGDPNAAARSLAKAVHLSPRDVAIRGDLARVLPATDASGAATRAAGSLVPAPTAGSVGGLLLASPDASVEARESVTRATAASAAALSAAGTDLWTDKRADKNAGTLRAAGVRLAKAYHLSPSGVAGEDAYALMALVTARRAAVGDGWGPEFRLAAGRRCAAVAEVIKGRDPHLAAAVLCAASESALAGGRVDVAAVHARRCAEVAFGETNDARDAVGVIPTVHAATATARCAWASGDAATAAAELRLAISAAAEGAACASHAPAAIAGGTSFKSSTTATPRVVSAAGDAAAASFALLPGASVDVPPGSCAALTMAAACASLAVGEFKAAEALLRDAQRGAVDLAASSGGVQPLCASASKALLGAALLARAKPTEDGGGGDPKAAKEAWKVLARAMRGAGFGTTLAAACGTLGVEAELAKGGKSEGDVEAELARLAGWSLAGVATPAAAHAAAAQLCGSSPRGRVDAQKAVHAAPWAVEHWHRLWQRPDYHRRAEA